MIELESPETVISEEQQKNQLLLGNHLDDLRAKYENLVWYARSRPKTDDKYWKALPEEIRRGALDCQAMVEEEYPDEIDELRSSHGSFTHGFNSGMLACLRFIETASNPQLITDPEVCGEGGSFWFGGLEEAIEEFPQLDT